MGWIMTSENCWQLHESNATTTQSIFNNSMEDKVIFLLDKERYTDQDVQGLTRKDLEKWIAEEDYNDDYTIMKIDASAYNSVSEAIEEEIGFIAPCDVHEIYHVFAFGIK